MAAARGGIRASFSETWLSVRFEMLKHTRRRRLFIVCTLAIAVPLLFYIYYYRQHPTSAADFAATSLAFMNVLIVISAAMFAGDAVCGEFERKTSLILFPTPQNRSSIFGGKYIGALLGAFLVVSLYYLVLTLQIGQLFGWGNIPGELGKSFATGLVYSVAAVSLAFLVSSLLKHSMSATIVGFLALLIVLPIASLIITLLNHEPWYIVTYSAGLITDVLGSAGGFGGGGRDAVRQFTPGFGRGLAVMVVYGVVCFAAGMAVAVRKED